MANKTSLEKEIAQAEDRLLPKQGGDSLQRRLEDYARRFEESDDALLSQYPSELFEKTEETPRQPAIEGISEHQTVKKQCEETEPLKSESSACCTLLEDFKYSEVKPGWVEKIETRPDGTTIKHVSIDLTKVSPDEIDELDREPFDWSPSIRPPSMRDVMRSMGL